ncbi:MAG: hypothetical protein ACLQKK_16565 [Rhodomicrobium sp.]
MSERSSEALEAALAMLHRPQLSRFAQRSALPGGVTLLLEVAAGEPDALRESQRLTGRSEDLLKKAAGFFIEQVLLTRASDSYRILGTSSSASAKQMRYHMALILKWLHPDLIARSGGGPHIDKSALAGLVTGAWEALKTEDRRAAYDAELRLDPKNSSKEAFQSSLPGAAATAPAGLPSRHGPWGGQLALYRIEREPLWIRLLSYLGRLK